MLIDIVDVFFQFPWLETVEQHADNHLKVHYLFFTQYMHSTYTIKDKF